MVKPTNKIEEKASVIKKTITDILKFSSKTIVITAVCVALGVPTIVNSITPIIKTIFRSALKDELSFFNMYTYIQMVSTIEKQYKKITEQHTNIYAGDLANALTYYQMMQMVCPDKLTPEIAKYISVIQKYYDNLI